MKNLPLLPNGTKPRSLPICLAFALLATTPALSRAGRNAQNKPTTPPGGAERAGQTVKGAARQQPAPEKPARNAVANTVRDPFWPVGYTPPRKGEKQKRWRPKLKLSSAQEWAAASRKLNATIQGFSKKKSPGGRFSSLALVNNRVVEAGDRLTVIHSGKPFTFLVLSVNSDTRQLVIDPIGLEKRR